MGPKTVSEATTPWLKAKQAGVNPVYGLYPVLAATPIEELFTSSVYMNIDSTGALAATVAIDMILNPTR